MKLYQSLRLEPNDIVAFIGAGGKTTAMFQLADEIAARNQRVITTTTTRMGVWQNGNHERAPLVYDSSPDFTARLDHALGMHSHVHVVGEPDKHDPQKASGLPPSCIDGLAAQNIADAILYEADGARSLSFKAPASHEPVIANSTTLLVPIVGVSILGQPLDDAHVHRPEIVARLSGARLGDTITPLITARVLAHDQGGLKSKPASARAMVLINQVETASHIESARTMAQLLLGYNEIDGVAIGAAQHANHPILETHRRVAAIVMAAGAGTRMRGRIKQLLPWRGKTLIENAIDIAVASNASEKIVILGAHVDEIRPVIRGTLARIQINSQWQTGHASTIRAGINALAPTIDAAIFINADQPLLTSRVINRIMQTYFETDASIVAPVYAGKRTSPVLFNRTHFAELLTLQNEQGGRELLSKYRDQIEFVEFDDESLSWDVDTPEEYERVSNL
jgi:molybdenum cofactor cytidylyltransferase